MTGSEGAIARAELGLVVLMLGGALALVIVASQRVANENRRMRDERLAHARYAAGLEDDLAKLRQAWARERHGDAEPAVERERDEDAGDEPAGHA